MSNTPPTAGPIASDARSAITAAVGELLQVWSGALDPIRPGDDTFLQLEGMNDAGLLRVLDALGGLRHVVDGVSAHVMGSVTHRSTPGPDSITRPHGHANPMTLLADRWRISRPQAASLASVGAAITPQRRIHGDLEPTPFPEIAAAIEPRATEDGRHAPAALSIEGASILLREMRIVPNTVCQAPGLVEARLDPFHHGDGGQLRVEVVLGFDGWDVSDLAVESAVVVPVDVFRDRDLELVDPLPRAEVADQFGLE
ncbi:hypothetical protein ABMA10_17715 [Plantibacter sp. RU18]